MFGSAPCSSSAATIILCPFAAAAWSGVQPLAALTSFTPAPFSINLIAFSRLSPLRATSYKVPPTFAQDVNEIATAMLNNGNTDLSRNRVL